MYENNLDEEKVVWHGGWPCATENIWLEDGVVIGVGGRGEPRERAKVMEGWFETMWWEVLATLGGCSKVYGHSSR